MISMLECCSDVYEVEEEKIKLHCQVTRVIGGDESGFLNTSR